MLNEATLSPTETATAVMERGAMVAAMDIVDIAIERRNTIPILSNARFQGRGNALTISGTDLDMTIEVTIPGAADSRMDFTAPAELVKKLLKNAPRADIIGIDQQDEDVARLEFEKVNYRVQCLPSADFPGYDALKLDAYSISLPGALLETAFRKTVGAMSEEATRYYLNGVFLTFEEDGRMVAVATDGHRLYRQTIAVVEGNSPHLGAIVPAKACNALVKLWKGKKCPSAIKMEIDNCRARFSWDCDGIEIVLQTKLIDGTFPSYQRVIPDTKNLDYAVFLADELSDAIKSCSLISSERGRAFKLHLANGLGEIAVNNPDQGSADAQIPVEWKRGESLEIGFNARYMIEAIAVHGGGDISIGFSDAGSPARIEDADTGFTAVLMPMRV